MRRVSIEERCNHSGRQGLVVASDAVPLYIVGCALHRTHCDMFCFQMRKSKRKRITLQHLLLIIPILSRPTKTNNKLSHSCITKNLQLLNHPISIMINKSYMLWCLSNRMLIHSTAAFL